MKPSTTSSGTSKARPAPQRRIYQTQLTTLVHWAEDAHIPLHTFGKRPLDDYLVWRQESGHTISGKPLSQATLYSDALCAKVFMKYCSRYDLIPRNLVVTTDSHHALPIAENLLEREFSVDTPHARGAADRTCVHTGEGWLYLAIILDLFSRCGIDVLPFGWTPGRWEKRWSVAWC